MKSQFISSKKAMINQSQLEIKIRSALLPFPLSASGFSTALLSMALLGAWQCEKQHIPPPTLTLQARKPRHRTEGVSPRSQRSYVVKQLLNRLTRGHFYLP